MEDEEDEEDEEDDEDEEDEEDDEDDEDDAVVVVRAPPSSTTFCNSCTTDTRFSSTVSSANTSFPLTVNWFSTTVSVAALPR